MSRAWLRACRLLLAVFGCLAIACTPGQPSPVSPIGAPASPTVAKTTVVPRNVPALTAGPAEPESVAEAQRELADALAAPDWPALSGRLAPQVAITERLIGGDVRMADAGTALRWLQQRWRPGLQVGRTTETAHYGLVQFETGPWLAVSPSPATLWLGAHRYDVTGQASLAGAWRIDSVVFGD